MEHLFRKISRFFCFTVRLLIEPSGCFIPLIKALAHKIYVKNILTLKI